MGDPFWRRFSSGKDRSVGQHTRERTLSTEYANLNTRRAPVGNPPSGDMHGRSRNDLFSTDWKWKGKGEKERAWDAESGERDGDWHESMISRSPRASQGLKQAVAGEQARHRDAETRQPVVSDSGSPTVAEPSLGAVIQLQFSTPLKTPPDWSPPSPGTSRRSRNDSIYNVNHLTVTPPTNNIPDTSVLTRFHDTCTIGFSPTPTQGYSARRHSSGKPRRFPQMPLNAETDQTISLGAAEPIRTDRFTSLESSTSSETSIRSDITSFTEPADRPEGRGTAHTCQASGETSSGFGIARHAGSSRPSSPVLLPITPMTPDVPRPPGSTFSSFYSAYADKGASMQHYPRTMSSSSADLRGSSGFKEVGLFSPQSEQSLSRSSTLTIVQSPSEALANVTRKAGVLLMDSDDGPDSTFGDTVEGRVRLRLDITSRQWLVGYGRYAKVYLASCKLTETATSPAESTGWNLCAAKVFDADIDSVNMANKESTILRYLHEDDASAGNSQRPQFDGRAHILERFALVDDTIAESPPLSSIYDLSRTSSQSGTPARSSMCATPSVPRNNQSSMGLLEGHQLLVSGGKLRAVHAQAISRRRSTSEATAILRQLGRNAFETNSTMLSRNQEQVQRPILLLPFCANGSMATFLKTNQGISGVDGVLWLTWFEQGLKALSWCRWKGVLHNDIKPANFLLDDDHNLKLADFGSALCIDERQPPNDGIGLGTVSYSSPEIVDPSSERKFSFPSDMFSFGVTMRQCMTGREPYEGLHTIETMYHVRKGNYWEWQARQLLSNPAGPLSPAATHLQDAFGNDSVRRAESLREPVRRKLPARPSLARTPSSDVFLRKADLVLDSPSVKHLPEPTPSCSPRFNMERHLDLDVVMQAAHDQQREKWLQEMVDPEPNNRPTPTDLLMQMKAFTGSRPDIEI